jgi:GyrI-like small molecule binding domain
MQDTLFDPGVPESRRRRGLSGHDDRVAERCHGPVGVAYFNADERRLRRGGAPLHGASAALPGRLVATATHTGPIAAIGDTHQAVCEWSKQNGYRLAGPRWEIYGDPDPSTGDFDVDVFWSLVTP